MHLQFGSFWGGWHFDHRPLVYAHTPWWHVAIGRWEDRLFSERHGYVWCRRIGRLRLTIRKMKRKSHGMET